MTDVLGELFPSKLTNSTTGADQSSHLRMPRVLPGFPTAYEAAFDRDIDLRTACSAGQPTNVFRVWGL